MRPTTGRVKQWIFDVLDVEGRKTVLDLFAGTGGLGIAALARGAERVCFVDDDAAAVAAIRENLRRAGEARRARVLRRDVLRFLASVAPESVDIAFADPPYQYPRFDALVAAVARTLNAGGLCVLERPTQTMLSQPEELLLLREKRFGGTTVSILRRTA